MWSKKQRLWFQKQRLSVDLDPRPGARRENHSRRRIFISASEQNFVRASVQHARDRPKLVAADICIGRHADTSRRKFRAIQRAARGMIDQNRQRRGAAAHFRRQPNLWLPPDELALTCAPRGASAADSNRPIPSELPNSCGDLAESPFAIRSATCSSLIMARPFYRQANQTKRPGRATTG